MQPTTPPRPTHRLATITPGNDLLTRSGVALALLMLGMPGVALPQTGTAATSGPDDYTTVPNDNVWRLASKAIGFAGGDRAAAMVAILRRNPDAFIQGNLHRLKRGVSIVMPSAADIAAEDPHQAALLLDSHLQSVNQNEPAPAPHPLRAKAATPAPVAKLAPPAAPSTTPPSTPVAKAPVTAPAASKAAPVAPAAPVVTPKAETPVARAPAAAAAPSTTPAPIPAPLPAPAPAPVAPVAKAVAPPAPVAPPVVTPPVAAPATGNTAASAASAAAAPAPVVVSAPAAPTPASPASAGSLPGASAAPVVATPAPVAKPLPAATDAEQDRPLHLLPYAMLGVLLTLPVGWWAYRRRGKADMRKRLRNASNDFRDSKDSRHIKPKRVEISNAAVEVARAVETLKPTVAMVKLGDVSAVAQPSVPALSAAELREQIALKLEIARACIDVGRALVARSLLAAVQQEGAEDERAAAAELMLKLA